MTQASQGTAVVRYEWSLHLGGSVHTSTPSIDFPTMGPLVVSTVGGVPASNAIAIWPTDSVSDSDSKTAALGVGCAIDITGGTGAVRSLVS